MLTRNAKRSSIIIVEGGKDVRIYGKHRASQEVEFIVGDGKENVVGSIEISDRMGLAGVLGIVDADFWNIEGRPSVSKNLLITDFHDIEISMICSESFDRLVEETASTTKVANLIGREGKSSLAACLLERASEVGMLRLLSAQKGWCLKFEDLDFSKFVDRKSWAVDRRKMVECVLRNTEAHGMQVDEVLLALNAMDLSGIDPRYLAQGHDTVEILGIGLRKQIGSRCEKDSRAELLEQMMRLCYDSMCFRKTQLYADARHWAQGNRPYDVFT